MQNLRIVNVQINNSSSIDVTFTDALVPNLVTSNVSITADTSNVPDSEVLEIRISGNVMFITCQPLTQLATYFIKFKSTLTHPFISIHGTSKLLENDVANQYMIVGPIEPDNPVHNYLTSFYKDSIYKIDDDTTVISKYIKSLSIALSRALYDIRQLKNENYLSFNINDEQKTRGEGPFDRLNEEAAYEILRVGRTPSDATATTTFVFDDFPSYPVTLQRQSNVETLEADSTDDVGKFNINSLILNLEKFPVTKVNSIVFTFISANPIYTYNISTLGYQIKDSRYDQEFGFSFAQLEDNQIKINSQVLEDPNFSLDNIFKIDVEYESKNLGIVVDQSTVVPYTVLSSIREVLPPIINIFSFGHAPIVDTDNQIFNLNGVTFTDPNSSVPDAKHPAFITELPFRLNALPSSPGQYSIDYNTGTAYVYGNDLNNDGTGPYPPLATYKYRFIYKSEIDYVYDSGLLDIVALPKGSLVGFPGNVTFDYEEVLIPGIDYNAKLHQEVLGERINNNLLALNLIKTQQSPITNVFRIFNETSGEIYTLDRWSNDKIYFRYNNPPRLNAQTNERVTLNIISNDLLFVDTTIINSSSLRIYKVSLNDNNIGSSSEDSIASSFNTSLVFSNTDIFEKEKWYNSELDSATNIDRLTAIGQYMTDYINGIVYCAVSSIQDFNIGTATYKNTQIKSLLPHIVTVDDIYYRISPLDAKNKQFSYTSFTDDLILPEDLDISDESFLNGETSAPYQLYNSSVGIFLSSTFISGVTNQISFIRSIYEYQDLLNSTHPLNFVLFSSSSGFDITVNTISKQIYDNVQFDGTNYYITINENIPYISDNITYTFSIVRESDSAQLWDGGGTIVPGDPIKLILSGINSPSTGELVNINYSFTINDLSRVVVDYNKGDLFIDYTYVADEIIISYEYGDNVIDFRTNKNLPANTEYFVSYKAGALRDALLKNFGTLVNIPELTNFDVDFNRERYRDALMAALSSFVQGPTLTAIKNIGKTISHIEPEIIESVFLNWSLGNSLLNPQPLSTTGDFQLLPGKFDNGVLVNSSDQTIKLPVNSNLRLEEGTFETWITPQWNGLDNDAALTFNILKDGYDISSNEVFIGAGEFHPEISDGFFTVTKDSEASGTPNTNKDGIFIYYDLDSSENFYRWYVRVIDGYVGDPSSSYKFKVSSTGKFYDSKSMVLPKPSNLTIFTGVNSITFSITSGGSIDEGITFLSDLEHYLLDFGESESKNRVSIYKDISGYLNFKVIDKDKLAYSISADISSWKSGESHHIASSWKLNTRNNRDEMHLFLDGFEVPNIIRYGQKLRPYLHEKYRTINPEEIAGSTIIDIIGSTDLHTTLGSASVTSSINFSAYNIFIGNTIFIEESGFDTAGYTILGISGQTLLLNSVMPMTLPDAKFSINKTDFTVTSDIDIVPNIIVTTIPVFITDSDLFGTISTNVVASVGTNFETSDVAPGYLIKIDEPGLETTYVILEITSNTLVINGTLPLNFSGATFQVYANTENEISGVRALRPDYSISKDVNFNNILTISNGVYAGDLILIRTLGLNYKRIKKQYYVWSDGYENILMTKLPAPIALDEAVIKKVILPTTSIGPSNSTLSLGVFTSSNLTTYQTTNQLDGRTLSVTISGNNVNFSSPVTVTINGSTSSGPVTEAIVFSDYGTLDSANLYVHINYIKVVATPLVSSKNALNINVKEKYSIIHKEFGNLIPVIRYSYQIGGGATLQSDGYGEVRDENNIFSGLHINNYLYISSPAPVAGYYLIRGLSEDRKSIFITPTNAAATLPLPSFSGGVYQILDVSAYRSGLQNGFFTFEIANEPGQPFLLSSGFYELDYSTYARIKIDPLNSYVYIGSDLNGTYQINSIIDQVKIYSVMLTDTRVGETIPSNQASVTKDFNSLKELKVDSTTLVLINFNDFPFINMADFYINSNSDKLHFQSSVVVNENFKNSLVILDTPIVLSNDGILDTKKEGTIELWTSPIYDTSNDPNNRFYFDAYSAVVEEAVSVNSASIKLSSPASRIISVKLKAGDPKIDYFAGGKIELDTQRAIQEEGVSVSNNSVIVAKPILQVISVKIIDDFTGTDYFVDGSISTDQKTIYLGKLLPTSSLPLVITYQSTENNNVTLNTQVIRLNKQLPYQNSHVIVNYIPKGLQGDRISLFKDSEGFVNFAISASGLDHIVRGPAHWASNTWHRIKASYKINGPANTDEIRLFLDGYEFNTVLFGTGAVLGEFTFSGLSSPGDGYNLIDTITFTDPINTLFIGTEYTGEDPLFGLIDNFRISNISRPIYAPYGESLDVNYSTNLDIVFPVTSDLFTTYLSDYDSLVILNEDFAVLKNRKIGLFDFSVNILDSLGIVNSSLKVKEVLEKLIKVLKPANSRVFIEYTR